MKFNSHNIRYRTWIYFTGLTLGILAMMWFFQIVLLSATFQDMKVTQIRSVADRVENGIRTDRFNLQIEIEAVRNQACGLVYNDDGVLLYQVDSLGLGCVLNERELASAAKIAEYIDVIKSDLNGEMVLTVENNVINQSMILYGREIISDFGNFYIFLNTPLDPIDSTITIITNQFIYVTLIVFGVATVLAFYMAKRMANPIVRMNKSALDLAKGHYDVHFEPSEFEEITELATTLNHTSSELKKMDELRRDLIANVSHDIKTPLTMIKAYAEMIRDLSGDKKAKRDEHLGVILDEVTHLDALVKDMTQLTQLQSNVLTMHQEPFDLVALTYKVVHLMEGLIDEQGIEIEFFVPEEVDVIGDRLKIQQVLYNFLSNAIKFVGDDKKLVIQILLDDDTARFEISDHGIGIQPEELQYIWDRYYKIDKHHARNPGGTGLGLSIASAILKAHDTDFGVESTLGEGSTFWFTLKQAK